MQFEPSNREEVIVRLTLDEAKKMLISGRVSHIALGRLSEVEDEELRQAILASEAAARAC